MRFTDRFIQLPIETFDSDKRELGLDDEGEKRTTIRLVPTQLESYFPSFDKRDEAGVQCRTKSGDVFFVYMTIGEFEKLLNDSDK